MMSCPDYKENPLVSVLIPTRDRYDLLCLALKSVLNQSYKNLQIIVHDNSVSDNATDDFCRLLLDHRVEYFKAEQDLSMTENWNIGFSYVKGDFFVRLDDDNVYTDDFVKCALSVLRKPNLGMVTFSGVTLDLNKDQYFLFEPEEQIYILNKNESMLLEFNALTDSNYSMYSMGLLMEVLNNDPFDMYATNLPDRFLHYRFASYSFLNQCEIAFLTSVKGITRFDYRSRTRKEFTLSNIRYKEVVDSSNLEVTHDCQGNFALHRLLTIKFFFHHFNDDFKVKFENEILSQCNWEMYADLGNLTQSSSIYKFTELVAVNFIIFRSVLTIIQNPFAFYESRLNLTLIPMLGYAYFSRHLKYVLNCIFSNLPQEDVVDIPYGTAQCKKVLDGEAISLEKTSKMKLFSTFRKKYS